MQIKRMNHKAYATYAAYTVSSVSYYYGNGLGLLPI